MSMSSWPQQQREQHPASFSREHAIFASPTPCIIHSWACHPRLTNTLYHSFVSMPSSPQQHPVAYHCWLQIAMAYPESVALWEGRMRTSASSRGPSSSTWATPSAAEASSTLTRFSLLATAFTGCALVVVTNSGLLTLLCVWIFL